ncbi:hypothetical protein [Micromonospora purpureochromogenes]|uniref:Peptidase MA superfamily n=1 Tax=Micromonospora purpureochromogenes TaxID=47872 RepID=A0ABX2RJ93_9ACTN|nr:hypothetical protein [Micromonospora purpureochromogenes]NYF55482.1 hypothetical protein [Micromonospora purpureochromogenes]
MTDGHDEPRLTDGVDESRLADGDQSGPVDGDESRPAGREDQPGPMDRVDESRPADGVDEPRPADGDGPRPADAMDESRLADGDQSRPADAMDEPRPVDESRRAEAMDEPRAADGDGPRPLDGVDEPRSRRRWPLWAALAVVLAMVGCGVPSALLAGLVDRTAERATVDRPATRTPDPATAAARRVGDQLSAQLARQADALLGGDRRGFLAVADPAARADLGRRFAALRALRVTVWRAEPSGLPTPVVGQAGQWRQLVTFRYCFLVPDCAPSPVLIGTRWRETGGAPLLVAVEESRSAQAGVRPWEVSDLVVAVGPRTMVATTPALRGKLPGLLAEAESAAAVADRYAVAGPPPDRYRIFYAGGPEWRRWYGGGRPKWTAGYAITVGGGHHEVVLNADGLTATATGELLRHELTHAASLPARGYPGKQTWWLVEGLAEYAGADGAPVSRYEGLDETGQLVGGGWNGRLDALTPADAAPADRVGGSYGVGYLAVRHLVDRYGEQQVLDFFRAVVHDRQSLDDASEQVLGDPWTALHDECVAYVRAAVR